MVINLLPPLDVTDPESFMAAMILLFNKYPEEVVEKAVFVIPTRSDRPTLKTIREVCDEIYAPIEREGRRQQIAAQPKELPRPERTPEEQARIDTQVMRCRRDMRAANFSAPSGLLAPIRPWR